MVIISRLCEWCRIRRRRLVLAQMNYVFGWRCTLAPPCEYGRMIGSWRWCDLMSNYLLKVSSNYSIGTAQWTTAHLQECLNERYCRCLLFYRAYFYAHGSCSSCCGDMMQVQCDMEESSAATKPSTSDTATAAVSAGVLEDFESFIEKFTSTQSVRYEQFAEIWKELQMSLIFAGRQSDQECREVYLQDISATPHLTFFKMHF